jgi:hypothetical protein
MADREFFNNLGRSIGAAVIHHEHLNIVILGLDKLNNARERLRQSNFFVIRRNYYRQKRAGVWLIDDFYPARLVPRNQPMIHARITFGKLFFKIDLQPVRSATVTGITVNSTLDSVLWRPN